MVPQYGFDSIFSCDTNGSVTVRPTVDQIAELDYTVAAFGIQQLQQFGKFLGATVDISDSDSSAHCGWQG